MNTLAREKNDRILIIDDNPAIHEDFRKILTRRPRRTALHEAEAVLFGGHGGVNGGANLHPRLFVTLYEAASRRDMERVTALQDEVLKLTRIYHLRPSSRAFIQALKCALAELGLCTETMAEPIEPLTPPEREFIKSCLPWDKPPACLEENRQAGGLSHGPTGKNHV